jgi:3-hydroxyisobutyrate dehydrogenase-like beta-hydroxyacid dehydrogenase
MKIGFIGVGLMGEGMVINLMRAGHQVKVLAHRNRAPIEAVVAKGASEAADVADLAREAAVILLCVDKAETVSQIMQALAPHLAAGQIIIDSTTSTPETSRRLAAELMRRGVAFADAPLTGGPEQVKRAEAGALVGTAPEVFEIIRPVIASYCSRVEHLGPAGAGHTAKLISNYLACGMIALIADSYGLARRAKIDWRKLYDVQLKGSTNSGALRKMVGPALEGDYDGYLFSIANAAKDMGYYCELAESFHRLTPLAQAARDMLQAKADQGLALENVSRMLEEQQP